MSGEWRVRLSRKSCRFDGGDRRSSLKFCPQASNCESGKFRCSLKKFYTPSRFEEENMTVESFLYQHLRLRGIGILWLFLNSCLLTLPAIAEISYTPADVTVAGNGRIKIDLNHDGIIDFTIAANDGYSQCYFANEFYGMDTLYPATGNGVVASNGKVTALASGTLVGSSDSFQGTQALIASFVFGPGFPPCFSYLRGWCYGTIESKNCSRTAYMGLAFKINGQIHYGWAYLSIYAAPGTFNTTLKGFAYETVAGRAIMTGLTSGY